MLISILIEMETNVCEKGKMAVISHRKSCLTSLGPVVAKHTAPNVAKHNSLMVHVEFGMNC